MGGIINILRMTEHSDGQRFKSVDWFPPSSQYHDVRSTRFASKDITSAHEERAVSYNGNRMIGQSRKRLGYSFTDYLSCINIE